MKNGKKKGKFLPKNEEICEGKAHTYLIEIFRLSQMSFSIRRVFPLLSHILYKLTSVTIIVILEALS